MPAATTRLREPIPSSFDAICPTRDRSRARHQSSHSDLGRQSQMDLRAVGVAANSRLAAGARLHLTGVDLYEGGAEDGPGGGRLDNDGAAVMVRLGGHCQGQAEGFAVPAGDLAPLADDG